MNADLYPYPLLHRHRRNRKNAAIRALVSETQLHVSDLVYPVFITEGTQQKEAIRAMPGVYRLSLDLLIKDLEILVKNGLQAIAPFPVVPEHKKTKTATEAYNPHSLISNAISLIKKEFPELLLMTDIALDPFNSDGHDGIVGSQGEIQNDSSVEVLCKMALMHAASGADFVCPSDMMDGRIGAIRKALDLAGFEDTGIMSYSAKYASAFYGPFREALSSAPKSGDKKTYQMDPANSREAILEVSADIQEGADMVMVKPAQSYLDIISKINAQFDVPIAAYQVSGEYAMLAFAIEKGVLHRENSILESLLSIKRAGARMIWTYFAKELIEKKLCAF